MDVRAPETPSPRHLRSAAARDRELDLARHAVILALRCLGRLDPSTQALDLMDRARELGRTLDGWDAEPPTPEVRDTVMRSALAIQVAVLGLPRRR
jgi:hypothetical protein